MFLENSSTARRFRESRLIVIVGIWCLLFDFVFLGSVSAQSFSKQIWSGTFHQTSPIPWSGPMELYIRYNSDSDPPQKIEGVITWPTLGKAQVRIEGIRQASGSMQFREVACLAGDCGKVVVGGVHELTMRAGQPILQGTAKGSFGLGLMGKYTLSMQTLEESSARP